MTLWRDTVELVRYGMVWKLKSYAGLLYEAIFNFIRFDIHIQN